MQAKTENKMGTMPIPRLLLSLSLPMALSMLVQALYNVVDSIYVSRVDEAALTSLSMAFPMQNLMIAVASGFAVGMNALLSRSLGAREFDKANRAAGNGLFLGIIGTLLFVLFGLFGADAFINSQTTDEVIRAYGAGYLQIVCGISVFSFGQVILERLLQSTGRAVYSMITQATGAIINILLDPVFIFGYFGLPAMGVKGAAIATVIGQFVAMSLAFFFNVTRNPDIHLSAKQLAPKSDIIGEILRVGIPSTVMQSIGSVMTFAMNKILIGFSSTAVAVFGVYFRMQSFVVMPVIGINGGLVPIIAYNYGARQPDRIMHALKLGILSAVVIMVGGLLLFQIAPQQLLSLFDASEAMTEMGTSALRIISTHFPVAAFCIITGSMFQALGDSVYSMYISIMRQLAVLIPVAWLLSLSGNVNLVWLSFPIAEVMSLICSTFFLRRVYKKRVKPLYDAAPVQ